MTGSLRERNGKFYIILKFKNEKGEWRQKQIATGLVIKDNKRKAEKIMKELLKENSDEKFYKDRNILFVKYLEEWFECGNRKVDQITKEGYYNYLFKHIIPYFEPKKLMLEDVKPRHIADYYDYKATSGRLDGKSGGISSSSLRKHRFILNKALNSALIKEMIISNPAAKIPLPDTKEKAKVWKFLNVKQANEVLAALKGHVLKPMVVVALYYGLRKSEILGLKWDAVDFENETLEIKHTVVKNITIVKKDKTKNTASKRKYKLLPEIKELLKQLKVQQSENKKLFGREYIESDYVFTWPGGKLIRPDYVTHAFQNILKKHNLQKLRFHDLRHSCASILFDKGWNVKDIQEHMRHADVETTLGTYTHISNLRKEIMTKDLEGTFTLVS